MQLRQVPPVFSPAALSDEQARQFYYHLNHLGLNAGDPGIKLLQFICYRLSQPDKCESIPDTQITIRSLTDLANVLKYCDIKQQDACLSAIEALLPDENPAENLILFQLLPRHRKMAIIESSLASEDNVETILRNNDITSQLVMHAVDFSIHTPHKLLSDLQKILEKFNTKLIKDIEKCKSPSYKIDEQTNMHKYCSQTLIELIAFIRNSQYLLPPLIIEILSCINKVLLNNFGVTDIQKRHRRLVGFYITRFWSVLINKNCCHLTSTLAEIQFNGKYMAEDFIDQITAAYNTTFVNIIQKISTSNRLDPTINCKYRPDQLEIIQNQQLRASINSHIVTLCLNNYRCRGPAPIRPNIEPHEVFDLQLTAISLRLKMNLLVRIAQSSAAHHSSYFSPRRKATTNYRMHLFSGSLTFVPSIKDIDTIKSLLESAFDKHNDTSSEDYQQVDRAIAGCISLKLELLAFLPQQSKESYFSGKSSSPRDVFSGTFFRQVSLTRLAPENPHRRSRSEGNIFEANTLPKENTKKSPH